MEAFLGGEWGGERGSEGYLGIFVWSRQEKTVEFAKEQINKSTNRQKQDL